MDYVLLNSNRGLLSIEILDRFCYAAVELRKPDATQTVVNDKFAFKFNGSE